MTERVGAGREVFLFPLLLPRLAVRDLCQTEIFKEKKKEMIKKKTCRSKVKKIMLAVSLRNRANEQGLF